MEHSDISSMSNILVHTKGVHKLLINLQTNKATGPDAIPAFILKAIATELAIVLAKLFQLSLNIGEVPNDWRDASVVPLFHTSVSDAPVKHSSSLRSKKSPPTQSKGNR